MKSRTLRMTAPPIVAGALLAVSIFSVAGCRGGGGEAAERPVAIRVARPVRSDLEVKTSYLGTVRRRKEIQVAARVQGTVESLPWREGDEVPAGARLVVLAAPELEAAEERLRVESAYWCRRHEADVRLADAGALPRERAEESERACKSWSAALAEAEARFGKTEEYAPIGGTILKRHVEPGEHVLPGRPLILFGEGSLEIHAEVVEGDLARGIDEGTAVVIHPDGGVPIRSRVSEVAPIATGRSRTFTVKTPVPAGHTDGMRVGVSVGVEFILASERDCVAVPAEAIQKSPDGTHVFVVRGGVAVREPVETGIEEDGLVQVSFDWDGEEQVAVSNLEGLRDGVPVYPVPSERSGS